MSAQLKDQIFALTASLSTMSASLLSIQEQLAKQEKRGKRRKARKEGEEAEEEAKNSSGGQGKQAKLLNQNMIQACFDHILDNMHAKRDRCIMGFSIFAGLRAIEIASITWAMVTDAEGNIADHIALENIATKGNSGGRSIPMLPEMKEALEDLSATWTDLVGAKWEPGDCIIYSWRGNKMTANSIVVWFQRMYTYLKFYGCSSHSGRRTFATWAAKKIIQAGGSLKDVQELLGHKSLQTTQRYIQGDSEAKRNVITLMFQDVFASPRKAG